MIGNIIKCNLEDSNTIMGVRHSIRYSVHDEAVLYWFDDPYACLLDIGAVSPYREHNVWCGVRQDGQQLYNPALLWTEMSWFMGCENTWE